MDFFSHGNTCPDEETAVIFSAANDLESSRWVGSEAITGAGGVIIAIDSHFPPHYRKISEQKNYDIPIIDDFMNLEI